MMSKIVDTQPEWSHEADLTDVRNAFETWCCAVIAKDRATIETFHDNGLTMTLPDGTLLDKGGHINLEILTGMITMDLLSLKTRRCGQILLVWARRHMEGTEAPSVVGSTLGKGWVATETIKSGFDQADFSVWGREENGTLKCLAFELTMLI